MAGKNNRILLWRHGHVEDARIQILQPHTVGLVILGGQPVGVCLDAKVEVLAHKNRGHVRRALLHRQRVREDSVVHVLNRGVQTTVAVANAAFAVEQDAQVPAVLKRNALAQTPGATQAVQHARHPARVLPQLAGVALEGVNLLHDLDRDEDVVILEVEKRVWVVKQNVGIKNVVFHK